MRQTVVVALLAASTVATAQNTFASSRGSNFSLSHCTRADSSKVNCYFTVENPKQDDTLRLESDSAVIISPSGKEAGISALSINGNAWELFSWTTVRKGIKYNLVMSFDNFSENTIKYMDFLGKRLTDIPVSTSSSSKTTNVLPGNSDIRQRLKIGDTNYIGIIHTCFAVSEKATCLVSLMEDGTQGQILNNMTFYPSTLMQVTGLAVKDNKVDVPVGDAIFKGIAIK